MENNSQLVLSDYQRAILTEMGISSWQLADEKQNQENIESQSLKADVASSEVISKEDALAKLKQLKAQTQTSEITSSILVALISSDTKLHIFTDVLIALGLETNEQKHISIEQLSHYSDFPLSWVQGENVSFEHNQLVTPALAKLSDVNTKKQLWLQLQSAYPLQQTN